MSREVFAWNAEHFLFNSKEAAQSNSGTVVTVHDGPLGPAAVIPDAHLLFNADFARVGADLILHGEHGKTVVVHDYFASDQRARVAVARWRHADRRRRRRARRPARLPANMRKRLPRLRARTPSAAW